MQNGFFGFLALCFMVIILLIWVFRDSRPEETQNLVKKISSELLVSPDLGEDEIKDAYGNPLVLDYSVSEECIYAKASSAGPDKIFGNSDDIYCIRRDYNKSRLIGKWVVSKTKEFAKGVVSGFKSESKFKKEQ